MGFVQKQSLRVRAALFASVVAVMGGQAAEAADLTWTGDDAAAGGSGTWVQDGTTPNWLNAGSPVPWSPDNIAIFSAPAGTVTVSGTVTGVQAMQFDDAYTLNSGTVSIPTPTATSLYRIQAPATGTVTFNSVLSGGGANANIRKTGAGNIIFTGNNSYTVTASSTTALTTPVVFGGTSTDTTFGGFTVNAGTATFTGDNTGVTGQFAAAGTGATLAAGSNTAFGTTNRIRLDANSTLRSADTNARTLNNVMDIATDTTLGSSNATTNGALVFTTNNFAIGGSPKTLTINSPVTISGVITGTAGTNVFTKAGPSSLEITGASTYDRPTSVTAGTLRVSGSGRLGSATNARDVVVGDNGLLDLQVGGLSPNALLKVTSSDGTPEISLAVNDTVTAFFVNNVLLQPGVYGSSASLAANPGLANPNDIFSGTGQLTVTAPEPGSVTVLAAIGIGMLAGRRRRRI